MRYGLLDLGGESLSLTVLETAPNGELRTLRRDELVLRLERSAHRQNPAPGMVELAVETVRRLVTVAERVGCMDVHAIVRAELAGSTAGRALATRLRELVPGPVVLLTVEDETALRHAAASGTHALRSIVDAIVPSAVGKPRTADSARQPAGDATPARFVPHSS